MKKILFFSNNKNKVEEIKNLFKGLAIKVLSVSDFDIYVEPKENGLSFAENAKIKSYFGYKKFRLPCFSDDSGIFIEALDWKPNVFSKRFINSFKNRNDCFNYIFTKVKKSKKNRAMFKTSICLTLSENHHVVFEGSIKGIISEKIRGKNGFGYDPIFIPIGFSKTFAEMDQEEKNTFSHRSIALIKLINFLS